MKKALAISLSILMLVLSLPLGVLIAGAEESVGIAGCVGDHEYTSVCDRDCNVCGEVRVAPHQYVNTCDATCDLCGFRRSLTKHTYTDDCDIDCNGCGFVRTPSHVYDNTDDAECNLCGYWRDVTKLPGYAYISGDVNADGAVNNRDLALLQQYINKWDVQLAPIAPPAGGEDGTDDIVHLKEVSDQATILKDIQNLGENEFLSYIAILTGKVLRVETRTDKDIQNGSVTLTFKVGDATIECYQMKGNGVDVVKAGDTITVRGVITNYYYEGAIFGKIEFAWHEASGTEVTLTKLVASAAQDLSTEDKILAAAKALKNGESLQKTVTLTGKVIDVETPYDANFGNITVNIRVKDVDIKCYRLKGNGVDEIKGGDTITVEGTIKNYNGIIEFDAGCQMTKRVAGTDAPKIMAKVEKPEAGKAYKFGMVQPNANKDAVYYLKGGMSGYYMATSSSSTAAIDVYLENTTGGFYLYAMDNGEKLYINMVVGGTHVNGAYETTAKTVYTYDTTAQTIIAVVEGTPYWFGTRNDRSYTTVGPLKTASEAFYCQFYEEA